MIACIVRQSQGDCAAISVCQSGDVGSRYSFSMISDDHGASWRIGSKQVCVKCTPPCKIHPRYLLLNGMLILNTFLTETAAVLRISSKLVYTRYRIMYMQDHAIAQYKHALYGVLGGRRFYMYGVSHGGDGVDVCTHPSSL